MMDTSTSATAPMSTSPPGASGTPEAAAGSLPTASAPPMIVKQGWLGKKAEYLKDWRPRYFILQDDGQFLGFKNKPNLDNDPNISSNNSFTVRNCEILEVATKRPPYEFAIRGLQMTTVVIRVFRVDTKEERFVILICTLQYIIPSVLITTGQIGFRLSRL
jgi:hypothetical protein